MLGLSRKSAPVVLQEVASSLSGGKLRLVTSLQNPLDTWPKKGYSRALCDLEAVIEKRDGQVLIVHATDSKAGVAVRRGLSWISFSSADPRSNRLVCDLPADLFCSSACSAGTGDALLLMGKEQYGVGPIALHLVREGHLRIVARANAGGPYRLLFYDAARNAAILGANSGLKDQLAVWKLGSAPRLFDLPGNAGLVEAAVSYGASALISVKAKKLVNGGREAIETHRLYRFEPQTSKWTLLAKRGIRGYSASGRTLLICPELETTYPWWVIRLKR
jgi:hypothetical protein